MPTAKDDAYVFLQSLEKAIMNAAPKGADMAPEIRRIVANPEASTTNKSTVEIFPKLAFLNTYVLPVLHGHLQKTSGLATEQAREALLNEFHRTMLRRFRLSRRSVPSAIRLWKSLGAKPAETIYRQWKDPKNNFGLTQSCPDFALGWPFPHSVLVFEGKYWQKALKMPPLAPARDMTFTSAFFYRGLPQVEATKQGHPEWNYDYACLIAFDASPQGALVQKAELGKRWSQN